MEEGLCSPDIVARSSSSKPVHHAQLLNAIQESLLPYARSIKAIWPLRQPAMQNKVHGRFIGHPTYIKGSDACTSQMRTCGTCRHSRSYPVSWYAAIASISSRPAR